MNHEAGRLHVVAERPFEPSLATMDAWKAQAHLRLAASSPRGSTKAVLEREMAAEAFQSVVEHTQAELFAGLMSRCDGHSEVAEEILQETYLKAYRNLHKYRGDGQVESWLWKVMLSKLSDYYAKESKHSSVRARNFAYDSEQEFLESLPAEEVEFYDGHRETITAHVRQAIDQLPPNLRSAVIGRFYHGISDQEMADDHETSPGNIRVRVHRALRRLKDLVEHKALEDNGTDD